MDDLSRVTKPASVTEICPGSIYAVGASIALDNRRLTWVADDARGWLPVQTYIIRDGASLLELDTGITAHQKEIAEGLTWAMDGATERAILISRREPDAFINFGWIVPRFGINLLYYTGEQNPLNLFESFDLASDEMHLHHIFKGKFENIAPGKELVIGNLKAELLRTSLRLIGATWLYEGKTRTLFTSDAFAFVTAPSPTSSPLVEPTDDQISVERIEAYLGKKFDFLRGLDSSAIIADLEKLHTSREIDRICPTYGCIIEGRSAVDKVFERTIIAIKRLAKLPPRGELGSFHWSERAGGRATGARGSGTGPKPPMTPLKGRLPRLITPTILWTGGCLEYPYHDKRVHSHMSTYIIKGSTKSVIVDTGNPYHVGTILPGVQEFLGGRPLDYVFPTHYEWPHAGLLPNWMDEYPNAVLVGDLPETDLFYPEYAQRVQPVKAGDSIDLGDRELVFVPAVWRDINTLWAFDTKDRALFVSDAFAYFHHHYEGQCDQVNSEHGPADPSMTKFAGELTMAWARYTDAALNLSEIEKLIDMLKPELICPAHGTVVDKPEAMVPRMKHGLGRGS